MDIETLFDAGIYILAAVAAGMVVWYLSIRLDRPALKPWAIAVVVIPLLKIVLTIALPNFFPADTFRTSTPGPPGRKGSVVREFPFPVVIPNTHQELALTPRASPEDLPKVPVHLRFEVHSPQGDLLGQGEEDLAPDHDDRWKSLHGSVPSPKRGTYQLKLEIFGPTDVVDVEIREVE